MKYCILTLDVWWNSDDGFQVNQAFRSGKTLEITDETSGDEDVHRMLKDAGMLSDWVEVAHLDINWTDETFCTVDCSNNGEPILQLQAASEET